MARLEGEAKNPIDVIGQRVYLQHENYREYGVIVNAWIDDFLESIDCYVAFYPEGLRYGEEPYEYDKPYVLRYLYHSLQLVEDENEI